MSDEPRGPFDPTEPVPTTPPSEPTSVLAMTPAGGGPRGPVAFVKAAPLWAKIAVPVAAVFLIAGIAGAGGDSNKKAAPTTSSTVAATTTTEAATTTEASTTTETPTTAAPTTLPPATAPPVTQPPATTPVTQPPPTQGGPTNPGDTKNCGDFANYAQAKSWFDTYFPSYGDVAGLDADGDGIPCESLPGAP